MRAYRLLGVVVIIVFFAYCSLVWGDAAISIRVDPPYTYEGGNFWVYCTVPRHPDNRKVVISVDWLASHQYELDGAKAPKIFSSLFREAPCFPELELVVRCLLERSMSNTSAVKRVPVRGC